MGNLLKFVIHYLEEKNNHQIGILELDSKFLIDENSIKHKLLNCIETKIYRDSNVEFKKIKFNSQLSTSDKEIMDKFINRILRHIVSESNIL